jgi:type II secretory pathway pseudopilin PulG
MKIHNTKWLRDKLQAGDTIVEVVIAIAVIATVLTGAFIVSSRSLTAVRDSEEHSEVLQQLQGQVELLRAAANIPGFFNTTSNGQWGPCPDRGGTAICVTSPFCLGTDSNGNIVGFHSVKPPQVPSSMSPSNYYTSLNTNKNSTCFPNSTYGLGIDITECYAVDPPNGCISPVTGVTNFLLTGTWIPINGSNASYDQVSFYYQIKETCTGQDGIVGVRCGTDGSEGKPVINLYPQHPENVSVKLKYIAGFSKTVPSYNATMGWQVYAQPDGTLLNKSDNKTYPYLYWEGNPTSLNINMSTGFVVAGKDTKQFLGLELPIIGLNQKETNDFLAYWVPKMDNNKYNLIHFAGSDYTSLAPLEISPEPDSLLRVNMIFKAIQTPLIVTPQTFPVFHRNGFTVVEWGGAELF